MNNNQNTQPALLVKNLMQAQFIYGIYRLAGCLLLLDRNQRPYWKMQFSDIHGSVFMYMFTQPSELENLGHGAFVELTGEVKSYGKQRYIEVISLKKTVTSQVSANVTLANLPSSYCHNVNSLKRFHNVLAMIENRPLLHFVADVIVPMESACPFFKHQQVRGRPAATLGRELE